MPPKIGFDNAPLPSLTTDEGTWIDWQRVFAVVTGFISYSFFGGIAEVVGTGIQVVVVEPLDAVAVFVGRWVPSLLGPGRASIRGAWAGAERFVAGLGPASFLVALLIVIVTAYLAVLIGSRA